MSDGWEKRAGEERENREIPARRKQTVIIVARTGKVFK